MEITMYKEHGDTPKPAVKVKQYRFADGLTAADLECDEDVFQRAVNFAWESAVARFWESAGETATHFFGPGVRVNRAGRSGGWLVVSGLGDPAEWDELTKTAWGAFETDILAETKYLSTAGRVKMEIIANRWNEPGAQQYNFIETADGESRCVVDIKRERDAAPELHKALQQAEAELNAVLVYGMSAVDPVRFTDAIYAARAALALASPVERGTK